MHCKDVKVAVLSQLQNNLLLNNVKQNYQPYEVSGKAGGKVQRNTGRHRKHTTLNCYKKVNRDSPEAERHLILWLTPYCSLRFGFNNCSQFHICVFILDRN